jgi:hypothetical protein
VALAAVFSAPASAAITERTMGKRDKDSPLGDDRHGSYGVEVPRLVLP